MDINITQLAQRLKTDNENILDKGVIFFPPANDDLLTGYCYGEFYDWDLYFENVYLSYFGVSQYCFANLKAFLARQHANGFVSRTLIEPRPYQHFKPFLAQTALLGARQTDFLWLNEEVKAAANTGPTDGGIMDEKTYQDGGSYYDRLKSYLHHWFWYLDFDKNGLPVWNSSDHSGMDNQFSRAGTFNAFKYEGVDLACYLYRELEAMKVLAEQLNKQEDQQYYQEQIDQLANNINKYFWDEEEGFYFDRNEQNGELVKVKSVAGFLPLFIGVASKEQADRLVDEHLLNPEEFWIKYPIPAYSKTEPDFEPTAQDHGCNWRGTTWIPTNYMVFHGLIKYGYHSIAKQLCEKTFELVFEKNKSTREYYNGLTGEGYGLDPFWGWSTLAYMMPLELEKNYCPMAITSEPLTAYGCSTFQLDFPTKNCEV